MSTLVGQLTYFYTDKVGMAAGAIATMFIVCKIIDAFTDLIMGNIIDHTKPGKEKYRPWLLKAGIPAGIVMVLMFTVPKIGDVGQIIYVTITNILLTAVLYTAMAIPYNSLYDRSYEQPGRTRHHGNMESGNRLCGRYDICNLYDSDYECTGRKPKRMD